MDPQNQITGLLSLDRYNLDKQQEQPQQINIEATIENLEKEGYSPSRIIDIMGQYGYEREEAVDQYTAVLDARRDAQLADQEQRRKIEEDQRSAFFSLDQQMEDSVKKKDSALGLGGGPSGLPSDSQEELINPVADPTLVDLASRRDTNISNAFINSSAQKALDSLLQIAEVYDEYGLNVKDWNEDQVELNSDLFKKYGDKITKYSRQLRDLGYNYDGGRLLTPEYRSEFINEARSELKKIQSNYSKILENANKINEEIGVDLRYNPSSNKDLGLFLRGAYEYTLSVDEQIQKEANDIYASIPQSTIDALVDINKENLDREYNAGSLGGRLAEGFADKTFQLIANVGGTVWDWVSYFPDDGSAAARAQAARDTAEFFANRQQARRIARQKYLGVGDDIANVGMTDKLFNLIEGDYEGRAGEVWASLFGDVEGAIGDGLWSAAEFWASGPRALGSIMFVDVASSNYNYNKKHNPHMGVIENTLSSGVKGGVEMLMERVFFKSGLGAQAQLKRGTDVFFDSLATTGGRMSRKAKAAGKAIVKEALGKKGAKEFLGSLLEEGAEEALTEVVNWYVDAASDVMHGKKLETLNTFEVVDAFFGGVFGGLGPSSLGSLASNIGHSKLMKDRQLITEWLSAKREEFEQEQDPARKKKLREEVVNGMVDFKILLAEEASLYENLSDVEAAEILSLNQDLARIKQALDRGQHWNGTKIGKEERKQLEKRFEEQYKKKVKIESEANKRAEENAPEEAEAAADAGGGSGIVKPKKVSKEDSSSNKEMPNAAEPAPEGQGDQKKELDDYDETKDQSGPTQEQPAKKDTKKEETKVETETETEGPTGTFEVDVENADDLVSDTENVGEGKGQMKLPIAAAISRFVKNIKKSGKVKKVLYFRNYEEMAKYNPEVARMMKEAEKDGNVVAGYYDAATGTVLTNEYTRTSDVAEEILSHGMLADIIGKDSTVRAKLFKQIQNLSKTNKVLENLINEVKANYKADESSAEVQEEVIAKFLVRFAENPASVGLKQNAIQRLVQFFNNILRGLGVNATIKGVDDLQQIALKYKYAYEGGKVDVDASTTTTGEAATQETATEVATEETTEAKREIKEKEKAKETESLFLDAVEFVKTTGKTTATALQKKFKIDFSTARSFIERMAEAGMLELSETSAPNKLINKDVDFTTEKTAERKKLDDTTEKTKEKVIEEAEVKPDEAVESIDPNNIKKPTDFETEEEYQEYIDGLGTQLSGQSLDVAEDDALNYREEGREGRFSVRKKQEFTYLKDTEIYYSTREAVVSRVMGETGKYRNFQDKKVKVNDYFHFRNLYAKLTGNGKDTDAMYDMYFIKDGKKYSIKPPKPKTDKKGKVLDMPTRPSLTERIIRSRMEKAGLRQELSLQKSKLMSEVYDMLHSSNLNEYVSVSDFIPPLLEGQRETVEAEIEGYVIAKKNIEAVMDMSVEQLEEMATEYSYLDKRISKETYPDFYNQSGLKRLPPNTIDGAKPNVGRFSIRRKPTPTASLSPAAIAKLEAIPGVKVIDLSTMGFEGKYMIVIGYDSTNTDQSGVRNGAGNSTMLSHRNKRSADKTLDLIAAAMKDEAGRLDLKEGDYGSILVGFTTQGAASIGGNPFVFKSEGDNLIAAISGIEDVNVQKELLEAVNEALVIKEGVLKNEDKIKEQRDEYKKRQEDIPEDEKIKSQDSKVGLKERIYRVLRSSDAAQGTELLRENRNRNAQDKGIKNRDSGVRIESIEDLVILINALSSTTVEGFTDELNDTAFKFRTDVLKMLINKEVMEILAKNGKKGYDVSSLKQRLINEYSDHELINAKSGSIVAVKEFPFRVGKDGYPTRETEPKISKSDIANDAFPYKVTSPLVEQYMNKENKEDSAEENAGVLYMLKGQLDLNDVLVDDIKDSGGTARGTSKQQMTSEGFATEENQDPGKKDSEGRFSIRRKPEPKTAMSDTGEIIVQDMSRFQEVRNFFLRKLVRKYEDIYQLQEAVEKGIDGSLPESQDFKNAETLMYGKAANDLEILQEKVDEITKLIKDKGLTIEEVENYMYGLHARERNELILKRDGVENGSGITNEEADAIIKEADQKGNRKDLDEAVDLIREIQKNTRETMVEFGLESQEKIDELEEKFQFYVPLGGLATDELDSASSAYPTGGAGLHIQGGTFKQAKGRKTKAPNVLAQIVSQNASIHIKSRTNEALQSLAELVEKQPVVDKNGNAIWKIVDKPRANDPHVVGVRINGKQKYIRFKDASYAEALKGLGVQKANALVKMLRVPNNWLRASFTSLSPEFIITNFARDIQAAIINAAAEADRNDSRINGEKVHNEIRKLILPTLKALGKAAIGKEASMDKEIARYYKEFKEDGGKTGWAYSKSLATIAAELEAASGDKSKLQQVFGKLKNFKDSIEAINDSVENSIRLSAYIAARRAGVTRAKAAEFAKNITVNFNQHGEWGPSLNGVYLFFNASVQSSMTFARSMFYLKDAKTPEGYQRNFLERVNGAQKMAFGMAMLGGLITLLNQATSDDDEDGVSFYDKIPDYIKERNIIIMRPDGKNYFKIPLPYGYSLFHNTGVTATEFATGARTFTESTLFMGNSFINAFNPVSFGQAKDLTTKTVKAAFPTALKPAIDVATNTTYFGSPVTAEQNRFIQSSESNLSFRSPKAVRDFFVWMNEATGGSPVDPGTIDVNPDRAWYYLEFFLGGTGRFLERTFVDTPMNLKAKAEDNNFEYEANDIPFLRVLYGQPSKYYDSNKYNENTAKVSALATEIRNPAKRPSTVTPGRYNNIQKLDAIRKDIEKQLKQLRAAEREARKIEDFTERSVRIQEIRNRKNSLYMRFNKAYEKLRGNE